MALPKGFIKNIKLVKSKVGFERRQEILDDIDNKGTYLPRGVAYEDMDTSFVDFIKDDMKINLDEKEVPVIFLTLQRWSEFSRTWQHSDKYKNIKMPFITIVRKPDIQVGQNQAGNWNIPGDRGYTYIKVPTFEGGRKGIDVYKIPQPTAVDVTYDVRLFCNKMRNLNVFNTKILKVFNARQRYIDINGHPMPLLLENVSDESNINDFEKRRFYVQNFNILLSGYILDEDEFEVIPTVNRLKVSESVEDGDIQKKSKSKVNYSFKFDALDTDTVDLPIDNYITLTDVVTLNNIDTFEILVNGVAQTFPILIENEDTITINITRVDSNLSSFLSLTGYKNN
jgi:hypothetical protein